MFSTVMLKKPGRMNVHHLRPGPWHSHAAGGLFPSQAAAARNGPASLLATNGVPYYPMAYQADQVTSHAIPVTPCSLQTLYPYRPTPEFPLHYPSLSTTVSSGDAAHPYHGAAMKAVMNRPATRSYPQQQVQEMKQEAESSSGGSCPPSASTADPGYDSTSEEHVAAEEGMADPHRDDGRSLHFLPPPLGPASCATPLHQPLPADYPNPSIPATIASWRYLPVSGKTEMYPSTASSAISRGTGGSACNSCHICGKFYARHSTLKTHLRTHNGHKPYQCSVCQKSFTQAANLTAHLRTHSGEKPFKCPVCNRGFSQSSSVTTHMRTHSGDRPYRCSACGKGFADSSTLTKHYRTHTGEKPYQCKACDAKFSQSGNLNRHMRTHRNHFLAVTTSNLN